MSNQHLITDLIDLFEQCFYQEFNTKLVKGENEPIYLPANASDIGITAKPFAQVVFAHGYFASAMHEISHWCLAGEERRQKIDFGYWYCPDGRTAQQQTAFQQVEIKPQAIEWAMCLAAGFPFNVSCDNLSGDEFGRQPDRFAFEQDILAQVETYLQRGFPPRAQQFMQALQRFYQTPAVESLLQFVPSRQLECA